MKTRIVNAEGRQFEIREMTWREFCEVREHGEQLPATWPLEQQFAGERAGELADIGVSAVLVLAQAVYELTYGVAGAGGSAPADGTTAPDAGRRTDPTAAGSAGASRRRSRAVRSRRPMGEAAAR